MSHPTPKGGPWVRRTLARLTAAALVVAVVTLAPAGQGHPVDLDQPGPSATSCFGVAPQLVSCSTGVHVRTVQVDHSPFVPFANDPFTGTIVSRLESPSLPGIGPTSWTITCTVVNSSSINSCVKARVGPELSVLGKPPYAGVPFTHTCQVGPVLGMHPDWQGPDGVWGCTVYHN